MDDLEVLSCWSEMEVNWRRMWFGCDRLVDVVFLKKSKLSANSV